MGRILSDGNPLLILALAAAAAAGGLSASADDGRLRFGSGDTLLEVDASRGVFTALADSVSGIGARPASDRAGNFRLLLDRPGSPPVSVTGSEQQLTRLRSSGGLLEMSWDGPLKDEQGAEHDVAVRLTVRDTPQGLVFRLSLRNSSDCRVREVWYPVIAGLETLHPVDGPVDGRLWVPTSTPTTRPLTLPFEDCVIGYPGHAAMSYAFLHSPGAGRSLFFSSQESLARYRQYRFFRSGEGDGSIALALAHLPFTAPGGEFTGSDVVLRFFTGEAREAAEIYRDWFGRTFGISRPSDSWIRGESFFQMIMFMLPEGTINYRFRDIPQMARDAAKYGIRSFMISGFNRGGHDNGYPDYSPDPRLGTGEELEAGIRECHRLGVKVYFFVNYHPMMLESDWYRNDLVRFREHTEDGGLTWDAGWGMGTLKARMGHVKRMTWANLAFPEFRRIIVDQFEKLAMIGADGVHVDKMFPTSLTFTPGSPLPPDTAAWEGAIQLTKEVFEACRRHCPHWAISFETNWDRMLQFGGATWWVGNQLVTRSVFPENCETLLLASAYDYLGVNNAVRNGHAVMVAPLNFCRTVGWPPFQGLASYIRDVKAIQDSLKETVFYGQVLGPDGFLMQGGTEQGLEWNVFRNAQTGRRVCILTNSRMEPVRQQVAGFAPPSSQKVRVHSPGARPAGRSLPGTLVIPPERIVFVEEL